MVVTRSQARATGQQPVPINQAINRMRRARRWIKRYRPNDITHRHRLHDAQPRTQHVVAYDRRT